MCLYFPNGPQKSFDQLVAESIGLPDAQMEVRTMLHNGAPVPRSFLKRIASALNVSEQALNQFEGKPLRTFYSEAVCGGVLLCLQEGHAKQTNVEVPMAFQSALAGILLGAELVADAANLRATRLPVETTIDILKPLGSYFSFPRQKHPSGRCICQDEDYLAVYKEKYCT
jgi:hypothetical protein